MILKKLELRNFRRFKADGEKPGLEVDFQPGLNVIIGENDAGKSAVIDAIKLVLQTQGGEFVRITDEDFYTDGINISPWFQIDCTIGHFSDNEAKNFVEYLSTTKNNDGSVEFELKLHYVAKRENGRPFPELRVGNDDGVQMDGKAKELLKCVYLKPLRDAAREMRSGRNSRISQILYNHPVFRDKEGSKLVEILKNANEEIKAFFGKGGEGEDVLEKLCDTLEKFFAQDEHAHAGLKTSEIRLKPILESLSLVASEIQPGLGVSNLLFIAAELLLMNDDADDVGALKLALIEELEAHLHPQAQLRLIDYLQQRYNDTGAQVVISTHSPTLASKINLKSVILIKDSTAYGLGPDKTLLQKGDYLFLQRFLDVTKANLFFAKGLIMVEGDAENLVIPVLADILGLNLASHGVSVVNVGSLAFHRYIDIFRRSDGAEILMPISIITDSDVMPKKIGEKVDEQKAETEDAIRRKRENYDSKSGVIKSYIAPNWTFEYCLGLSSLRESFYESVLQAEKIENSTHYALTADKIKEVETVLLSDSPEKYGGRHEFAYHVYVEKMLRGKKPNTRPISKAIVAQCFANNLRWRVTADLEKGKMFDADLFRLHVKEDEREKLKSMIEADEYLSYLVHAIKHAVGQTNI